MTPDLLVRVDCLFACQDQSVSRTGFEDLDELLATFVASLRRELGDQVVGVYLQGSFALGVGDEWSDVDFIVAVEEPVTDLAPLNELHAELYERPTEWAKHLEGSYIPVSLLRGVDPDRTPVPFLNNGARQLELDPHCNSAVVRWILLHHGITLFGRTAPLFTDPVSEDDLRREAGDALVKYLEWGASLTEMSAWEQPYLVLTICRLLRTIERGDVATKATAGTWAAKRLPSWRPLIERALRDRLDPWKRVHQRAAPYVTAETHDFVREVAETYSSRSSHGA